MRKAEHANALRRSPESCTRPYCSLRVCCFSLLKVLRQATVATLRGLGCPIHALFAWVGSPTPFRAVPARIALPHGFLNTFREGGGCRRLTDRAIWPYRYQTVGSRNSWNLLNVSSPRLNVNKSAQKSLISPTTTPDNPISGQPQLRVPYPLRTLQRVGYRAKPDRSLPLTSNPVISTGGALSRRSGDIPYWLLQ